MMDPTWVLSNIKCELYKEEILTNIYKTMLATFYIPENSLTRVNHSVEIDIKY